jgi:glutamate racemase
VNNPIGIFDSGVGGLTVAGEIIRQLPHENIIYFGDTARVPYGPRDQNEVRGFVFEIINYLIGREVKLVVIACNTGTAAGLVEAQAHFDVPIVGVVEPGARGAVQATRNRRVGVIGTVGTINSGAYSKAIRGLDAGVTVYSAPCPKFVEIVEKGMISDANFLRPKSHNLAKTYLTPLLRAGIDSLIMGCTHYPLLSDLLTKVGGPNVVLISSAEETAREVKTILERRGQLRAELSPPDHHFVTTGEANHFTVLGSRFLGRKIVSVEALGHAKPGRAAVRERLAPWK